MSQRQFAAKIGCDPMYLSQVERGIKPGGRKFRVRCAAALGCSVAFLETDHARTIVEYVNRKAVISSPEFTTAPDEVREWFTTIVREGGDLSVPGWSGALAAARTLFDLGLLGTQGGHRVTSTREAPDHPSSVRSTREVEPTTDGSGDGFALVREARAAARHEATSGTHRAARTR